MSGATEVGTPSRSGTVNRKQSLRKRVSLRRTRSGRSLRAGSMKGGHDVEDFESVFHTPIPTSGTPTDILAERFQGKTANWLASIEISRLTREYQHGGSCSKT